MAGDDEQSVEASEEQSGKTAVPLRILAVVVALVLAVFCGGIIAGASDNNSLPTCHDVSRGKAKLPSSGDCFDGSGRRADAGMVFAVAAGIAMGAALLLSFVLAATGRRGREFLIAGGAAIAFMLLEIGVIHL